MVLKLKVMETLLRSSIFEISDHDKAMHYLPKASTLTKQDLALILWTTLTRSNIWDARTTLVKQRGITALPRRFIENI